MPADELYFNALAERPVVRNDQISETDIAIELATTKGVEAAVTNFSLNLCIVIDRSGSMAGEKLEQAKQSCVDIYSSLNSGDRLTVLAFDDDVSSVVNPQTPRDAVIDRIKSIESGGGTNLSKGWYLGLLELQTYATEQHINRLILLSDGQATDGEQKPSVLGSESSRARDEFRITTSTIGIGTDFQEDILSALARYSGGRFWFIGEARIDDIIKEEFGGALSILLERPSIEIALPTGVSITAELNDLPKISGRYRLRPIKANDQFGLAIRVQIDPNKVSSDDGVPLYATLYDGAGVVGKANMVLKLGTVEDYVQSPEEPRVAAIVSRYLAAKADEQMLKQMDAGDTSSMLEMLKTGSNLMKEIQEKLAGASPTNWDAHLDRLRMEIAENESLAAVAQLINLMQGLGKTSEVNELLAKSRKMASQKGMRGMGYHGRSAMEDWASRDLLTEAKHIADGLLTGFPNLRSELLAIQGKLNEQLAQFS